MQDAVAQRGGLHLIVQAMRLHASELHIQRDACAALLNLTGVQANKALLSRLGGPRVILNAMCRFIGDVDVARDGCGALWNLAVNNEAMVVEPDTVQVRGNRARDSPRPCVC